MISNPSTHPLIYICIFEFLEVEFLSSWDNLNLESCSFRIETGRSETYRCLIVLKTLTGRILVKKSALLSEPFAHFTTNWPDLTLSWIQWCLIAVVCSFRILVVLFAASHAVVLSHEMSVPTCG